MLHRHIEHAARRRTDREERRIGRLTLLAQRGKHDLHDLGILLRRAHQHLVKGAGSIAFGRAHEGVLEAEPVEEGAQAGIVVRGETVELVGKRVRHARERLAEMGLKHLPIGHIRRHLAHAIHIVGKADQLSRVAASGEYLEGMAHHGRAHDLAESADMRQAGRPIAGLEDHRRTHLALAGLFHLFHARLELARKLERPGFCGSGEGGEIGHDVRRLRGWGRNR